MIERLSIHNGNKRQHSDLFLRSVCQWLLSFSRVHRCLLGCDPNSDEGQFIIDQLPHIPLYEGGVARADWFIDAFFDQSHEHLYEQIHARVLSVVLPTRDMEGKIKCDQILLDQAYMPQTFNHPHFEHHAIPFSPETGPGYFVDLEPFEASEMKAVHKYDQGAVVLFGGSAPFVSALKMSAQAAMLAGAGFVVGVSEEPVPHDNSGVIWAHLREPQSRFYFNRASVFVWGSGLLPNSPLMHWATDLKGTHIIDAGALTYAQECQGEKVLLMHAGEMAKFLKTTVDKVNQNRVKSALKVAKECGGLVLLKGDYPVLAQGSRFHVVNASFPSLNRAGTGDILSGLVGSFCAQGDEPFQAVIKALQVGNELSDLGRSVVWEDYEAVFSGH